MMETTLHWTIFLVAVFFLLILDLKVFHKKDEVISIKSALFWSAFWIFLSLLFNVYVYFDMGKEHALDFFTGYLLEKSLSIDNLFVFILIFKSFKIEPKYQHEVLFWGIFGALVMRAIFIFAGVAIIHKFEWIMYVFGAFLIYSGIKMLYDKEDESSFNPDDNFLYKQVKKVIPLTNERNNGDFFLKKDGRWLVTPFFTCLIFIEISDLIFAVDSIPAILSVTQDSYIVFTSNICAILGLRALYFALNGIVEYFVYLKYALSGILAFIGFKMCFNELMKSLGKDLEISNVVSLSVLVSLITISIIASIIKEKRELKKSN